MGLGGGANAYGFGAGDPINYSDPFGLCVWDFCIGEVAGVVEGIAGVVEFAEDAYALYKGAQTVRVLLDEAAAEDKLGDRRTEPTLPDKEVASGGGVTIEHEYRSGDHAPAHLHVKGGGDETRIEQNGKPLQGDPELTPQQRRIVDQNKAAIRRAVGKLGRWLDYKETLKGNQ